VVAIIVDVFGRCLCAQTYNIRLVRRYRGGGERRFYEGIMRWFSKHVNKGYRNENTD
jgi:hypothetical protein